MAASNVVGRLADLARERTRRQRSSAPEWAAGVLRDRIMLGELLPGDQLSEKAIMEGLDVSRNTLREAFRLLAHEKLLEHKLNRGVFVRLLDVHDVVDVFKIRRLIECPAILEARGDGIDRLDAEVRIGEVAAEQGRWQDVGTANIKFHKAIGSLLGSPRVDELMGQVLAELRLVFHGMDDPRSFYEPYLPRNREIVDHLRDGDRPGAHNLLEDYLADAEDQLVSAYR
ncbi:DNA-binding GntR family transcriptional regulator [Herbihabitans rhizosphaerae]|uniref:DNA-binding GntR family transcriptional regulator n=1 Tax=Herbihabitans rhizosphaerae TaxID=1872711 RepID=A0A4Q7L5Y4_9PSEU|nr:GntR family transcriptional regulator [Herbihabitans rhizosphaerae]RZS45078.1 DNA-binding GntR family transcriptional regulator [Herbihabitans rhizosphaerae]